MKACSKCGRPMGETECSPTHPLETLAKLFQESVSSTKDYDVCHVCKKELSMLILMGVGE